MKKKLWCFVALLPLCLVLLFCGCGDGENNDVPPVTTASVTLDSKELTLTAGDTAQLTVTATDCASVSWKSQNEEVVKLETKGSSATVTALSEGTSVVTVTGKDANGVEVTDTCTVTVEAKRLSVFLPAGKLVLTREKSATVKAIAAEGLTGDVTWESSDESVGTVEYQGLIAVVTAHKKGSCTITVRYGSAEASFELVCGLT